MPKARNRCCRPSSLDVKGRPKMKLSLLFRLFFLSLLLMLFATLVKPIPAYAMACCKDLNCEGRYQYCISQCSSQSCFDSCESAASSCAQTLCDVDCGSRAPCWFDPMQPQGCSSPYDMGSPFCMSNSDCTFPYVCMGGRCAEGACGFQFTCPYGYTCDNGFCNFECSDDYECGYPWNQQAHCDNGECRM